MILPALIDSKSHPGSWGLEHIMSEEMLREICFFSLERRELREEILLLSSATTQEQEKVI